MRHLHPLLLGLACVTSLTTIGCSTPTPSERVAAAADVPLIGTNWRLTQLGDRLLDNPSGQRAAGLQLQAQNPRMTGFGGCNRMFGGYRLEGDRLQFDQIGATKMACMDEARMKLEQDYFQALSQVAGWKINDSSLDLLDAAGTNLARFAAETPAPGP